jgi:hypothetical protein
MTTRATNELENIQHSGKHWTGTGISRVCAQEHLVKRRYALAVQHLKDNDRDSSLASCSSTEFQLGPRKRRHQRRDMVTQM